MTCSENRTYCCLELNWGNIGVTRKEIGPAGACRADFSGETEIPLRCDCAISKRSRGAA